MNEQRKFSRVGVELEGGWDRDMTAWQESGVRFTRDGSVTAPGTHYGVGGRTYAGGSEFITEPMDSESALRRLIKNVYPDHVNETCGFHVHVSFGVAEYNLLTDEAFWVYFLARWEAWLEEQTALLTPDGDITSTDLDRLRHRLTGRAYMNGTYVAQREHRPDVQIGSRSKLGSRYTQLNYCWALHGTVECRLLPMFQKAAGAIKALGFLLSVYEEYLANPGVDPLDMVVTLENPATVNKMEVNSALKLDPLIIRSDRTVRHTGPRRAPKGCVTVMVLAPDSDAALVQVKKRIARTFTIEGEQ